MSFAINPTNMPDIAECHSDDDEVMCDEEGGLGTDSPAGGKLFAQHKINDDLLGVNQEIETLEINIEEMAKHDANHFLVKARYEREIGELKEKIDKLANEKSQLVVQINSSPSKKIKNQESKMGEKRRLRIKELERQMASMTK